MELELLITNLISPLRTFYDHTLYNNLIYPHGLTYSPFSEGCEGTGGIVILEDKISMSFNYARQNTDFNYTCISRKIKKVLMKEWNNVKLKTN